MIPNEVNEENSRNNFVQMRLGELGGQTEYKNLEVNVNKFVPKEMNANNKEILERYYQYLRQNSYSKNTIESYCETIEQTLSHKNVEALSQEDLDRIRLKLVEKYQHNGNRMRFAAINLFCKKILKRDDLYLSIPRSKIKNKDMLTNDQIEKIVEVATTKSKEIYAMIQTLYDCALRKQEVCDLNLEDVNFETLELSLRNTKTGDQIVSMTSRVAEAIRSYMEGERETIGEDEHALFLNRYKKRIGEHFVRIHLKACAADAGINGRVYVHMLRASCITHLLNKGVNPLTVQRHARHKDFRTTMIYNRPTMQQMKADIERVFVGQPAVTHDHSGMVGFV